MALHRGKEKDFPPKGNKDKEPTKKKTKRVGRCSLIKDWGHRVQGKGTAPTERSEGKWGAPNTNALGGTTQGRGKGKGGGQLTTKTGPGRNDQHRKAPPKILQQSENK